MAEVPERLSTRERRRPEITARLLEAIEDLTADGETYADVSVERLATHAGISRATFYLYFPEKRSLLIACLDGVGTEVSGVLTTWLATGGPPAREDLRETLARLAAAYRVHAPLLEAVYNEAAQDAQTRGVLDGLVGVVQEGLAEHIERGQREGWVDAALLPVETAAWLTWSLQSGLRDLVAPTPEHGVEPLVEALVELWWHVLYTS